MAEVASTAPGRALPAPVDSGKETCSNSSVTVAEPSPTEEGALARSQAARRRRVLDAALQLAAEGGFDGVQMRDVAAAADVALGTVYRYFSSKERLLLDKLSHGTVMGRQLGLAKVVA